MKGSPSICTLIPARSRRPRDGSVLLLTLMVVSLLMVVVLAFVTLVRLELRSVVKYQDLHQARANAKLGAEMALARLQETAGPDTRVTLPASADASVTALPSNRMWTGVRDSAPFRMTDTGLEHNPDYNAHLGWLISTPPGEDPQPDTALFQAPFLPGTGNALLVGNGSVQEEDDAVAAPAVPLVASSGNPQGTFAFWVGDEASKAQVNLSDPFRTDGNPDTDAYRGMTIQRSGTEAFLDGFDPNDPQHDLLVGRAMLPDQLDLLNLSSQDMRTFFHDISLASYGLPTNIKRGGLKRDLTPVFEETITNGGTPGGTEYEALLAFQEGRIARLREETQALPASNPGYPEHVWNAMNAVTLRADQADPSNRELMFPPFSDMTLGYDVSGPKWAQLLSWAGVPQQSGNSATGLTPGRMTTGNFNPVPVIARYNLAVYWTLDWPRLKLHFIPSIVLWNPYDRPLNARDYYMSLTFKNQHMKGYKVNFRLRNPAWQNGDSFWSPQYDIRYQHSNFNTSINLKLEAEEIPAGAAIVYTMNRHQQMTTDSNGRVGESVYATLTAGLNGGGGYSFYVEHSNINDVIIAEADVYRNTYSSAWNQWDRAGLPLFFEDPANPGQADPDHRGNNLLPYPSRNIGINVNGIDPALGWEIVETVTTFTRGGTSDTKLLTPSLFLYPNPPPVPNAGNTRETSQPWAYLRHVHDTVPNNLHREGPESGIFPSIPGPPPSFPGNTNPFRPDQHDSFPLWGLSWGLRLPDSSYEYNTTVEGAGANLNAPIAWVAHYNPAAPYQGRSGADHKHYFASTQGYDNVPTYIGGFTLDPDYFDLSNFSDDDKHIFIGHSDSVPGGFLPGDIPRAILFQFPDSVDELTSPGALAMASLQSYGGPTSEANGGNIGSRIVQSKMGGGNLNPTYPIGNSFLHPLVRPDRAQQTYFPSGAGPVNPPISIPFSQREWGHDVRVSPRPYVTFRSQYDLSWVLNEMLWDDFFFTPDSNSRLRWQTGIANRGLDMSAQNVTMEGAFNINSTSLAAWRSLLLGMLDVEIANDSGESEPNPTEERLPFARAASPFGAAYSPSSGDTYDSMSNFTGYRRLTMAEVDRLAQAIVDEVATRGPFLSVADFVNRRLLSSGADPHDHRMMGTLQAAIEQAGLNESQESASDSTSMNILSDFQGSYQGVSHFFALQRDALTTPANRSAPGYFMQSDLLARIGSVLQARSDTFLIRAYGDIGDPDNPTARAWCELLVRRNSEYVDPADAAELHPDDVLPVNQVFGRRFEIIRFRWLTEEDV